MNTCKGYDRFCIEEEKAKEQQEKMRRELRARNKKHRKYIRLQEQSLKGAKYRKWTFKILQGSGRRSTNGRTKFQTRIKYTSEQQQHNQSLDVSATSTQHVADTDAEIAKAEDLLYNPWTKKEILMSYL